MRISFDIDFNEDGIAPDYDADSWEDAIAQIKDSTDQEVTVAQLKSAFINNEPIELANGMVVGVQGVYE